jgi:hypothetical protein
MYVLSLAPARVHAVAASSPNQFLTCCTVPTACAQHFSQGGFISTAPARLSGTCMPPACTCPRQTWILLHQPCFSAAAAGSQRAVSDSCKVQGLQGCRCVAGITARYGCASASCCTMWVCRRSAGLVGCTEAAAAAPTCAYTVIFCCRCNFISCLLPPWLGLRSASSSCACPLHW